MQSKLASAHHPTFYALERHAIVSIGPITVRYASQNVSQRRRAQTFQQGQGLFLIRQNRVNTSWVLPWSSKNCPQKPCCPITDVLTYSISSRRSDSRPLWSIATIRCRKRSRQRDIRFALTPAIAVKDMLSNRKIPNTTLYRNWASLTCT